MAVVQGRIDGWWNDFGSHREVIHRESSRVSVLNHSGHIAVHLAALGKSVS